jgi:hypothetical protein
MGSIKPFYEQQPQHGASSHLPRLFRVITAPLAKRVTDSPEA